MGKATAGWALFAACLVLAGAAMTALVALRQFNMAA